MNIRELVVSKYLRKEDFPSPMLLTIDRIEKQNVAPPGEAPEQKGVMYFRELSKGLVLNVTTLNFAAHFFGSDDTKHWLGKQIIVFVDETVAYKGKITGGLRLRAPMAKKTATHDQRDLSDIESDIPL